MSVSVEPVTLVMTATITPHIGTPLLSRSNPEIRMQDYISALKFYLSLSDELIHSIVFIENSDTDLSPIEKAIENVKHNKQLELIRFQGNDHSPKNGKGYGEFRLLDYGLDKSSLIDQNTRIWKVTGRLRVINLEKLVLSSPQNYDIYCDLRNVPIIGDYLGGNQWMDLRIFSFNVKAYSYFFNKEFENLSPHKCRGSPEQYFYRKLTSSHDLEMSPRFKVQPKIAGFGGHLNADYRSKIQYC